MRAELKSILRRGTNKDEIRRKLITELLRTEYPDHFAAGITDIEVIENRLDKIETLEGYLDTLDEISLVSLFRRARKEYGGGKWLKESYVVARLKRMMGDNIRNQILSPSARNWKNTLKTALRILPPTSPPVNLEADLETWDKDKVPWRVQLAIMARDVREAPYHHPFIRHLRMRHDGLGKVPAKYTHSRLPKWRKKRVEVKRRAASGSASPLSAEIFETEDVIDEDTGDEVAEDIEMGEKDRRAVSVILGSPEGGQGGKGWDHSVRVTVIEVDATQAYPVAMEVEISMGTKQEARVLASVSWSWGEHWM